MHIISKLLFVHLFLGVFFVSDLFSQEINQFNENKKRHGVWRKHYDNGRIRYSGQFNNGKEIGVFKFYENATAFHPTIIKEFSKLSDTATVSFYDMYGKLKSKGKMIGKKRENKWIYYFPNGRILSEENYKDGKLNGVLKNFYPNGKTTLEAEYKNGLKNGYSKIYTEDGILIEDLNYLNGKLEGQGKYYDLKGNLKEKGIYKNGKRFGKWEYYIDGEISDRKKRKKISLKDQ